MADIIYYVASSLDGYIATADHGVEWLESFQGSGEDYGFMEFYSSIDALLMGSRTSSRSRRPDRASAVRTPSDCRIRPAEARRRSPVAEDGPRRVCDSSAT